MKRVLSFLFIGVIFTGCSSLSETYKDPASIKTIGCPETKSSSFADHSIDEPYSFEALDNEQTWRMYRNIDDKCRICQIPDSILSFMTTRALIKTCRYFPLAGTHCFYDNPIIAVHLSVNRCNFLSELIQREDAASCLIDEYANLLLAPQGKEIIDIRTGDPVKLFSFNLIELLIGSGLIPELFSGDNQVVLKQEIKRHLEMEIQHQDLFSAFSRKKCYLLQEELTRGGVDADGALSIYPTLDEKYLKMESFTKSYYDSYTTVTVYTPFGRPVTGHCYQPLSQIEIDEVNNETARYSGIEIMGIYTSMYNCFSYVWNMVEDGMTCWINDPSSYLVNDNYEVTTSSLGTKIMYGNLHAGVVASDGYIHSKWGCGYLVCHEVEECPYSTETNVRTYYRERTSPITGANISGSDFVQCNVPTAYTLNGFQSAGYLSYIWEVEEYHGRDDYYSVVPNGPQASISFHYPTEFSVSVSGYLNNTCVVTSNALLVNGYY